MDLLAWVNSQQSIDQAKRLKQNGRKTPIHEIL